MLITHSCSLVLNVPKTFKSHFLFPISWVIVPDAYCLFCDLVLFLWFTFTVFNICILNLASTSHCYYLCLCQLSYLAYCSNLLVSQPPLWLFILHSPYHSLRDPLKCKSDYVTRFFGKPSITFRIKSELMFWPCLLPLTHHISLCLD